MVEKVFEKLDLGALVRVAEVDEECLDARKITGAVSECFWEWAAVANAADCHGKRAAHLQGALGDKVLDEVVGAASSLLGVAVLCDTGHARSGRTNGRRVCSPRALHLPNSNPGSRP